jgi:hypothetical protein
MSRSDVIRGRIISTLAANRESQWILLTAGHLANSNNRLENAIPESDYAVASTSWNSIALFFAMGLRAASAAGVGGFAAYAIETSSFGVPYDAFQRPYFTRQLLLSAAVAVAILGKFAHAWHYAERHTFHEDLGGPF